ncbi:uncharacterized protein LOC115563286 [Drosophila navojoa]|uniref:uncharacterized protein LOC115563286 n=1 Tax=Drosophila navojoa TaxID=7232 RepID=UPI0011BDFEBE|nr:uncharacterized protein LOC115563286 [Drosophila navojoa]
MTTVYEENDLDREFANFWSQVNCYSVMNFPYDQRCDFVRRANSCIHGTNFVPYIQLLSCSFKCRNRFEEHAFVGLFMILCFLLLLSAGHVANVYYSPALKVLSRLLRMNDHLAGVTIMALCNTIPDLLYQITIVNDRECVFANDMATSLFVVMFIGGLVCYLTTFQMNAFNTVRDLLFLIFGSMLLELCLFTDRSISYIEIIGMILVYVTYLIVNVIDLILIKYTLKLLRRELLALNEMPDSPETLAKIKSLTGEINKLSKEERVQIVKRRTTNARQQNFTFMTQVPNEHEKLDIDQRRSSRYFDMNRGLFKDFILAFKPIKLEDWRNAGIIERIFLVVRAPGVILCTFYIPLVDYEEPKNGWSKLLNCIQIWFNPALTITLGKSLLFRNKNQMWYNSIPNNMIYGLYSLGLTVPLSIFVFCQSDTRAPPKYHSAFSILNMTGSVFIIFQCTTELNVMIEMVGYLYGVSDQFVSSTLITATNCLGDLATILTMALHGYEKMAFAATIGGALLCILFHCGSVIGVKKALGQHITWHAMVGNYGGILFVIFTFSLLMMLLWTTLLNFNVRRSVGIFSMSIYGLYVMFAVLINKGIISPYEHEAINPEVFIQIYYRIMDTAYEENDMDREFAHFLSKVNCYTVVRFPYDERCEFVQRANSCVVGTNFLPYMHLMACSFKCKNRFEEHLFVSLFMIICFGLLLCMGLVAHIYYSPALKVISRMLHLNDHLAGVTIMALCQTIPDLLFQITIVNNRDCVFANYAASSMFVVMFTGGLICYITPFQMHSFNTVRDLLFLIFGLALFELQMFSHGELSYLESLGMIIVYVVYLAINVIDFFLIKYTLKVLRRELLELNEMPDSPEQTLRKIYLTNEINELAKEERVRILKRRTTRTRQQNFTFMTQLPNEHEGVEIQKYRNSRYSRMNQHLFKEFLTAIKPINVEDWRHASMSLRAFYLARAPIAVICAIYIPLVNYEEPKNGWSKLLNCIQLFLNPAITIVLGKSLIFRNRGKLWYNSVPEDCIYGVYSLVLTVPVAIFVFFHSDTRAPPKYHWIFSILNLTGSVFLIFQCSSELCVIFEMVGYIYDVPDQFMSVTVIAMANRLGDLATILVMALHGYEKMAYAATLGSPLFVILLHCSGVIALKKAFGQNSSFHTLSGDYGGILYILFTMGLFMTLLWTTLLNFNARRSVGIFSMSVFGLFILYAILINAGIISPFKRDGLVTDSFDSH